MTIKAGAYLAFIVSAFVAVSLMSAIVLTGHRANLIATKTNIISDIVRAVNQRRVVKDKYLRYHFDEFAIEWQVLHDGTAALLQSPEFKMPEELAILADMREDNAETKQLFARLVALHDRELSGKETPASAKAAEEQLVKRIWLLSDTIEDGASRLSEICNQERSSILRANQVVVLTFVSVLLALVFFILLFVGARIVRRLTALNDVIEVIGRGNLDKRVGDIGSDELGQLASSFDRMVGELQKASLEQQAHEHQLRESLNEKEVLLKEIHHRVKNNLQIISSLLRLQARRVSDASSLTALNESHNRVHSIALVHEQLYKSKDLASIDFQAYLQSLGVTLLTMYIGMSKRVSLQVSAANVKLNIDVAIPCGLIVNELLANSLKHAFPDDRTGRVWVILGVEPQEMLLLEVGDDGIGLSSNRDLKEYPTLGLQLVRRLVDQLRGTVEVVRDKGVRFLIRFPIAGAAHAARPPRRDAAMVETGPR